MIKALLALMILSLVGCAALGGMAAKAIPGMLMGDKPAISADLRIAGEANDSVIIGDNERTDIDADVVQINKTITENYENSAWLLALCITGWVLPTPSRMAKWGWGYFLNRRKNGTRKEAN